MPQMAPLNWTILFIIFNMIFIIINVINYYSFLYPPKSYNIKKKTNKINWKW
uniref:ATP synthase complex subunit 8 n=1 Tax=Paederus fuscipes TaxID=347427 RepID=A0A344H239_9COLE|nr:ATP synthase F0 subunit 8 [Paederus fuscipes]